MDSDDGTAGLRMCRRPIFGDGHDVANPDSRKVRSSHALMSRELETTASAYASPGVRRVVEKTVTGRQIVHYRALVRKVRAVVLTCWLAGLVLCACSSSSQDHVRPSSATPTGPSVRIVCRSLDGTVIAGDVAVIRRRAGALGAKYVRVAQSGAVLKVSIYGVKEGAVSNLCTAYRLDLRGVVAAAVPVTCVPVGATSAISSTASPSPAHSTRNLGHHQRPNNAPASPSSGGSSIPQPVVPCSPTTMAEVAKVGKFSVPLDDTSYNTLSSANQQLVSAALANFDCSSGQTEKDVATSYFIACAKGPDYGVTTANVAFLLGQVIVTGT